MARIQSYDPRTVFVESERWAEQDLETLRETRCPQYLWRCFDQSPLAKNVAFALPFRQMLANHLFAEAWAVCHQSFGLGVGGCTGRDTDPAGSPDAQHRRHRHVRRVARPERHRERAHPG